MGIICAARREFAFKRVTIKLCSVITIREIYEGLLKYWRRCCWVGYTECIVCFECTAYKQRHEIEDCGASHKSVSTSGWSPTDDQVETSEEELQRRRLAAAAAAAAKRRHELYWRYADVMYTNPRNLQHTIHIQQALFRQQLSPRYTPYTTTVKWLNGMIALSQRHLPCGITQCRPTQVNASRYNPNQKSRFSIDLPLRDERLSWSPGCRLWYRDGLGLRSQDGLRSHPSK